MVESKLQKLQIPERIGPVGSSGSRIMPPATAALSGLRTLPFPAPSPPSRLHVGLNAMVRGALRREAQLRMRLSLAKLKVQAIAAKVRLRAALAAERKELAKMTVATGERIQIENAIRARNKQLAATPNSKARVKHTPFSAHTLGESGNRHSELLERVEALERLHLSAPPLPDYLEKPWPSLRDWFAVAHHKQYPPTKNSGMHFLSIVTKVMDKLGPHLSGATGGVKGKGDADAFKSFVIVLARSKALKERGVQPAQHF